MAEPPVPSLPGTDVSRRAAVALAVLTAAVFAPGLSARFLWDDHFLIQRNPALRTVRGLAVALTRHFWDLPPGLGLPARWNRYYRPVVTLAYGLQWRAFGDHPAGFHVVSLALHVACVLLAFSWLRRRLGGSSSATLPAALGAALFALHPTRPESVTWISGSTDLWMALGVLLGLTAWDRRRDGLAALALVLALLAKETAIVVPALLATDALLLCTTPPARRERLGRAGAVAIVVALATTLRFVLVSGRATSPARDSPAETLRRVLATLGCYTRAAVFHWPPTVHLGIKLLDAQHRAVYPGWTVPLGLATALALGALVLAAVRRVTTRTWLADIAWYVLPLAPALNLFNLRLVVLAEPHNLYLPVLGLGAVAARGAQAGITRAHRTAVLSVATVVLAASAGVCVFHETRLQNDVALWTWEHAIAPDNLLAIQALVAAATEGRRPLDALRLDAEGCATAQRLGLRPTCAAFARGAAEDALAAMAPGDREVPARLEAFCRAVNLTETGAGAPAGFTALGVTVTVPAGAPWRRTLASDPRFLAACATASAGVRASTTE